MTSSFADSRGVLDPSGLAGEILPTPGRSDDRVSLLLDDGRAVAECGRVNRALAQNEDLRAVEES